MFYIVTEFQIKYFNDLYANLDLCGVISQDICMFSTLLEETCDPSVLSNLVLFNFVLLFLSRYPTFKAKTFKVDFLPEHIVPLTDILWLSRQMVVDPMIATTVTS